MNQTPSDKRLLSLYMIPATMNLFGCMERVNIRKNMTDVIRVRNNSRKVAKVTVYIGEVQVTAAVSSYEYAMTLSAKTEY